jgi:hypothetical protein
MGCRTTHDSFRWFSRRSAWSLSLGYGYEKHVRIAEPDYCLKTARLGYRSRVTWYLHRIYIFLCETLKFVLRVVVMVLFVCSVRYVHGHCFKEGITWFSTCVMDILEPVASPYLCQQLWLNLDDCLKFTWTTDDNLGLKYLQTYHMQRLYKRGSELHLQL